MYRVGIGMAITVNKTPRICTTQGHDTNATEQARRNNNTPIITRGARGLDTERAKTIIDRYLTSIVEGGNSAPKNARVAEYKPDCAISTSLRKCREPRETTHTRRENILQSYFRPPVSICQDLQLLP